MNTGENQFWQVFRLQDLRGNACNAARLLWQNASFGYFLEWLNAFASGWFPLGSFVLGGDMVLSLHLFFHAKHVSADFLAWAKQTPCSNPLGIAGTL